jgi:alpha-D-xyloside xylohydrolase
MHVKKYGLTMAWTCLLWLGSSLYATAQDSVTRVKQPPPVDDTTWRLSSSLTSTQAGYQRVSTDYRVTSWKKEAQAVTIYTRGGNLRITPWLNRVVRVQFGEDSAMRNAPNYAVSGKPQQVPFQVKESATAIDIHTADYWLKIEKQHCQLSLYAAGGKLLLKETPQVLRELTKENGQRAFASLFQLTAGEALYGLGQFRDGALNLRGRRRELVQVNTQVALPIVWSTNGWGLFWDNPSRTVFQDSEQGMQFTSDYGDAISYYLFTGQTLDTLIDGYRRLTGTAPMLPRWALGYHQSRNKYATHEELLEVAGRMRRERIPFSSIFIDYYYWGKYGTGSHQFDEAQFPDMPAMMKTLHDSLQIKVVATVWPAFKPGSSNYQEMAAQGYLLDGVKALDGTVYDPFNPGAARLYWRQIARQLVPTQIDGWFLDGPEPDNIVTFLQSTTFLGPAANVRNLFPLFHSTNFYRGLTHDDPLHRHYLLTRCAWASQQKNGTVVWSGDIGSSFDELKKQIAAGLNFTASGIPYWTTDIGGYSGGNPADPAYQEVFVRWWQYGAFCPIFRSHGRRYPGDTKGPNELWAFGTKVQQICTAYDELRYRLLPYSYSLTGKVTFQHYTPMRLLAFDFPGDTIACNSSDEFMYGPALLVCPITEAGATSRKVYLPRSANWIDFWTGQQLAGSQSVEAAAPIDRMPLFVKSGSIIPFAPLMQYTDERPSDTVELRVYPGADGQFELYEDDGNSTAYKRGEYSIIPLVWKDKSQTLMIGKRIGRFPAMLANRTFKIVIAGKKAVTVPYNGNVKNIYN